MFWRIRKLFFRGREAGKGFSIICVYNNRKILNDYLIKSLEQQTVPFELITIDNTAENFLSAAPLLNEVAKNAKHEYIMFVHQDVALDSKDWLAKARIDMEALYHLGAAGAAGAPDRFYRGVVASVSHGNPPRFVGRKRQKKPVGVQTLDGCLMIVPKEIFVKISFDEGSVEGWHLYVANYCLDLIRHGYKNYVLPYHVYHESDGARDRSVYQKTINKMIERHRDHVRAIYTTVGKWETR